MSDDSSKIRDDGGPSHRTDAAGVSFSLTTTADMESEIDNEGFHGSPQGSPQSPESIHMESNKRKAPDMTAELDKGHEKKKRKQGGSGRKRIEIKYIDNKSRRQVTFSRRKRGLMKKAYELTTLTGTQALVLIASETGHVYTFATPKLQPVVTLREGKELIQSCLNAPDNNYPPDYMPSSNSHSQDSATPSKPDSPSPQPMSHSSMPPSMSHSPPHHTDHHLLSHIYGGPNSNLPSGHNVGQHSSYSSGGMPYGAPHDIYLGQHAPPHPSLPPMLSQHMAPHHDGGKRGDHM